MNELSSQLNRFLVGEELINELTVLPNIKSDYKSINEKLLGLLDIYKIYIPTKYSLDIYNRLYLSIVSSLEKKNTSFERSLKNDNYREIKHLNRYGIIGGLESFRITASSGRGKTSCVQRCCEIIGNQILISKKPYKEVIPSLFIECPSDGSFKSLLYSILDEVDCKLGTNYFESNKRVSTTTDILLAAVSNVLINHVGLLIIDEFERVANDSRKGETLINYLTQLVNQSNIAVCFVGDESCNNYFQNKEYLSRRTIGLSMSSLNYDEYFYNFLRVLFKYQFTEERIELNGSIARKFYELSGGVIATIVSLYVEVQKKALLSNIKVVSEHLIDSVFNEIFGQLNGFLNDKKVIKDKTFKEERIDLEDEVKVADKSLFSYLWKRSKKDINTFINSLKDCVSVEYIND